MTAPERIPDLTDFTLPAHWYGRPSIRHTGPFSDVLFATKDDHIGLIVIGLRMEVVYPAQYPPGPSTLTSAHSG
jgi:hypothetical protein